MRYSSKQIIKALVRAGFRLERTRGSHAIYVCDTENGRFTTLVKLNMKPLPPGLVSAILRQAGLDETQLRELLRNRRFRPTLRSRT
jgi:predicted RNA binding protein YcfA (HicA-like mRNA interferase family)